MEKISEGIISKIQRNAVNYSRHTRKIQNKKLTGFSDAGSIAWRGRFLGTFLFGLWEYHYKGLVTKRIHVFEETPTAFIDTNTGLLNVPSSARPFESSYDEIQYNDLLKYLKTRFSNTGRLTSNFIDAINDTIDEPIPVIDELFACILNDFNNVKPYTYEEAFKVSNEVLQSLIFANIDISEMIAELGHTRIKTAGREVKHKQFDSNGTFLGYKDYHVVFETHCVNGSKLNTAGNLYAVRCWCTTTASEHWIWIEDEYKDDPLEAIASTFRIHENLINHITELKRQGDILLVELDKDVTPAGNIVALNAEQYFSLLTAQS